MLNPALLVSGGHLREEKKEGKCSSFSSEQHCMRGASFAPGNTQDICRFLSSPEFMCVACLSTPALFPQHTTVRGIGQPAGDSVESQANTGPAWQTYHLCVCMGTSGPPRLWGPLRLPVWQWAYTHSVGVYWCCHGSTVFTPTQVLVYYTNNQQSLQYQSKQAKYHNQTQDYFMNIQLNHWAALIQNLSTARYEVNTVLHKQIYFASELQNSAAKETVKCHMQPLVCSFLW